MTARQTSFEGVKAVKERQRGVFFLLLAALLCAALCGCDRSAGKEDAAPEQTAWTAGEETWCLIGSGAGTLRGSGWSERPESEERLRLKPVGEGQYEFRDAVLYAGDEFQLRRMGTWDEQHGVGFLEGYRTLPEPDGAVLGEVLCRGERWFCTEGGYGEAPERWNIRVVKPGVYTLLLDRSDPGGDTIRFRRTGDAPEKDEAPPESFYEIFVRSFCDSNGDGIGDLGGVTARLDYIRDMGFDGIWLTPVTAGSSYHKYDVENYCRVDDEFGSLADAEALLAAAHERGVRVIFDLPVNHTSSRHPWFTAACDYIRLHGAPGGDYGTYYCFSRGAAAGYYPVPGTDWYYEAQFTPDMPDLNLDSEQVRGEIEEILRFWLLLGADGFRLDACTSYYTNDRDRSIDFLRWLNSRAKLIAPDCFLVGEAWYPDHSSVRSFYESGADSFFCFPLAAAEGAIARCVRGGDGAPGAAFADLLETLRDVYGNCHPAPFLSNHDTARIASFLDDPRQIKLAQGLLALLRGSVFVYYGEEIGMRSQGDGSDPWKRLPMRWSDAPDGAGTCFAAPSGVGASPEDYAYPSVEAQQRDDGSILNYYRRSLRLRKDHPALARGQTEVCREALSQCPETCVFQSVLDGETLTAAVNLDLTQEHRLSLTDCGASAAALTDSLCVDGSVPVYNPETGVLTLPPGAIAILR